MNPIIHEFHSHLSPWEIFQRVYSLSETCFFLDSINFCRPDQNYSYIGADPEVEITLQKGKISVRGKESGTYPASKLIPVLRKLLKKYRTHPKSKTGFFTGGAVGFWGYEAASLFDKVKFRRKPGPGTPELYLGFYRDLLVYDHKKKKYYAVSHTSEPELLHKQAQHSCPSSFVVKNRILRSTGKSKHAFRLKKFRPEISREYFEKMVQKAKAYIAAGDIYQANLSQRFSFQFEGPSLKLYDALRKINPSPFASFLKMKDLEIISSSPERLITKRGAKCETKPIAGTRPRFVTGKTASEIERDLLSNEKERAEHIMLVDLERNDLGRVCDYKTVKVEEMMKIEKYSHVIHIVSKIGGILRKDRDALDLIRAVFPGGTVTGCPKIRCMEIIDELEPVQRGIYTGSVGYLGFDGDMDLNIVIRTLILQKNKGYLQVGAGIVYDSDPSREFDETLHKGEALAEALLKASS